MVASSVLAGLLGDNKGYEIEIEAKKSDLLLSLDVTYRKVRAVSKLGHSVSRRNCSCSFLVFSFSFVNDHYTFLQNVFHPLVMFSLPRYN